MGNQSHIHIFLISYALKATPLERPVCFNYRPLGIPCSSVCPNIIRKQLPDTRSADVRYISGKLEPNTIDLWSFFLESLPWAKQSRIWWKYENANMEASSDPTSPEVRKGRGWRMFRFFKNSLHVITSCFVRHATVRYDGRWARPLY